MIGIGPGDIEHMSLKAYHLLQAVEVIAGYSTYMELVEPLLEPGQEKIISGMGQEKKRAGKAIARAEAGKSVAVISSGDPGIYGMAGLVLEMLEERESDLEANILPGITAGNAAAASLGAPLMHDRAVISLSDLLTPWDKIEIRLKKAAGADLIAVLYNPASSQRREHIRTARDIFIEYRPGKTPVGIVRSAKRGQEQKTITDLEHMLDYEIDMLTTVIIGNSSTFVAKAGSGAGSGDKKSARLITPRGYEL